MASSNMSGGNAFDPCRQWLGISALELDDPSKLLGIESVDDPIRILQAAEARIARLQAVEAGPYEVARRALVARVEEARDRLLSAAATSGLPSTPAPPGSLVMPPSPTAPSDGSPLPGSPYQPAAHAFPHASAPSYPSASPSGPAAYGGYSQAEPGGRAFPPHPAPGYPPPGYTAAGYTAPGYPAPDYQVPSQQPVQPYDAFRGTGPVYRRSSSNAPLMLLVGALFTVVVALGLFAMQSPPSKSSASKPAVPKQVAKKPSSPPKPVEREPRRTAPRERRTEMEDDEPQRRSPAVVPAAPEEPEEPPQNRDDDAPKASPPGPVEATPEETAPPTPSDPEMKKPEPPPGDEPDVLAKIDDAVKRCFEALSRREYETAERAMKAVEGIAPEKREANRIAGWLQLAEYSKGFYDYRDQAIAAMKPGDEYDVKSKKIAVIDVTDGSLTVKVAGQQLTWPIDDIPGAVMQAVVESWFDAKPANQLYLGAYHFTKPEPDIEQAEACWSKAMIGGANASLLIPLATDPVVVDAVDAGDAGEP